MGAGKGCDREAELRRAPKIGFNVEANAKFLKPIFGCVREVPTKFGSGADAGGDEVAEALFNGWTRAGHGRSTEFTCGEAGDLVLNFLEKLGHAEPTSGEEFGHWRVLGVVEMGLHGAEFLDFDEFLENLGVEEGVGGETGVGFPAVLAHGGLYPSQV